MPVSVTAADETEGLRQRQQIDAWRAAVPTDAERLKQLVSKKTQALDPDNAIVL
jgi:hypothetical protein